MHVNVPDKNELIAILQASRGLEARNAEAKVPATIRRLCKYMRALPERSRDVAIETWRHWQINPDRVAWQLAELAAGGVTDSSDE